jgi:hypothetical protein
MLNYQKSRREGGREWEGRKGPGGREGGGREEGIQASMFVGFGTCRQRQGFREWLLLIFSCNYIHTVRHTHTHTGTDTDTGARAHLETFAMNVGTISVLCQSPVGLFFLFQEIIGLFCYFSKSLLLFCT